MTIYTLIHAHSVPDIEDLKNKSANTNLRATRRYRYDDICDCTAYPDGKVDYDSPAPHPSGRPEGGGLQIVSPLLAIKALWSLLTKGTINAA